MQCSSEVSITGVRHLAFSLRAQEAWDMRILHCRPCSTRPASRGSTYDRIPNIERRDLGAVEELEENFCLRSIQGFSGRTSKHTESDVPDLCRLKIGLAGTDTWL